MNMQVWLGFGASTFLICLTPGPNMLLVLLASLAMVAPAHPCARDIRASLHIKCTFKFSAEPKRWIKVMAPA